MAKRREQEPKSVPASLFAVKEVAQTELTAPSPNIVPLKPTPVYDSYWRFAAERQHVFFRRLKRLPPPWTDDPILQTYKFTNAYRASDRVSQYLIRRVIYRDDLPDDPAEVVFRVLLFKLFNRIETWELLEKAVGPRDLRGFLVQAVRPSSHEGDGAGPEDLFRSLHHAVRRLARS